MDAVARVQILDETTYILHSSSTLGKGMKPSLPHLAFVKQQSKLVSLVLVPQLIKEKEK